MGNGMFMSFIAFIGRMAEQDSDTGRLSRLAEQDSDATRHGRTAMPLGMAGWRHAPRGFAQDSDATRLSWLAELVG